jgi:hypothetical protein
MKAGLKEGGDSLLFLLFSEKITIIEKECGDLYFFGIIFATCIVNQ